MAVQRSVEELNSRDPDRHQGEVHGDPPDGRVALPQGRAQQPRAAARARASAVTELEPIVFEGVYPLYGARGHPRLVDAARAGHPGRSARPSSASPARDPGARARRGPCPALDELALPDRQAAPPRSSAVSTRATRSGSSRSCGPTSRACSIISARSAPASASGSRRTGPALDARLGTVYHRRRLFEESVTAHRGEHLVVPGPRGAGGAGDVPALLREAEDRRRRLPDLRRRRRCWRTAASTRSA